MEKEIKKETYQARVADFFDTYENYIIEEIIPEALAYYLKIAYDKNLLSKCPIINHLNSAVDCFNILVNIDNKILYKVEKILISKYNLKIVNRNESKIILISK